MPGPVTAGRYGLTTGSPGSLLYSNLYALAVEVRDPPAGLSFRRQPPQVNVAEVGATGYITGNTTTVVTATFTPPPDTLMVACASMGNGSAVSASVGTITDSSGATWTRKAGVGDASGVAEVWICDAGPAPAARTVTYDPGGSGASGLSLAVRFVYNAAPVAAQNGGSATVTGADSSFAVSVTVTQLGSLVFGAFGRAFDPLTPAVNTATTLIGASQGTAGDTSALFRSTAVTTATGATAYGFTNNTGTGSNRIAVYEVVPAPPAVAATPIPATVTAATTVGTAGGVFWRQTFEQGTPGATITTGNSDGAGTFPDSNPFTFVNQGGNGTATYTATAFRGSVAGQFASGTTAGLVYGERTTGTTSDVPIYTRVRFRMPVLPADAAGVRPLVITDGVGAFQLDVRLNNAGKVLLYSGSGSLLATSSATYAAGDWVDVGAAVKAYSVSAGVTEIVIYNSSGVVTETLTSPAIDTVRGGGANKLQVGMIRSSTASFTVHIDDVAMSTTGYPDWPVTAGATPVPATATAVTAVGAPTVQTGATAAPAVVSATTTVGAPAVQTSTTAVPATVTAVTAAPTGSVFLAAAPTPATIAGSTTVAAPAVQTGTTRTPATVAAATTIGAATVGTAGTPIPPTVAAAAAVPAVTVRAGAAPGPPTVGAVTAVGTPTAGYPLPTPQIVVDAFNDGVTGSEWDTSGAGGQAAESGGTFNLSTTLASGFYGAARTAQINIDEAFVSVRLVSAGNQALTSYAAYPLGFRFSASNEAYFIVTGGQLAAYTNVGGTVTFRAVATYSPTTHAYLAIGEQAGQIVWVTSPNGTHWQTLFSLADPFTGDTTGVPYLLVGTGGAESSTTTMQVDDLTTWGVAAASSATAAPATVTAATAVGAATVTTAATVTPATVAGSTTTGGTPSTAVRLTPAVVAAATAVPAPAVRLGSLPAPGTVAAVTAVGSPTVRLSRTAAPAVVAATTTITAAPRTGSTVAAERQRAAVPAYFNATTDASVWAALIAGGSATSLIVVNDSSGPGTVTDPALTTRIAQAQAVGIRVVGYVDTAYAARDGGAVDTEIDLWRSLYPAIEGIFLDQTTGDTANLAYYQARAAKIRSTGTAAQRTVVINPGFWPTDPDYVALADVSMVLENNWDVIKATPLSYYPAYAFNQAFPAGKLWTVFYNVPAGQTAAALSFSRMFHAGLVYVTDDVTPNPYDTLPPYWSSLLADIVGGPQTVTAATTVPAATLGGSATTGPATVAGQATVAAPTVSAGSSSSPAPATVGASTTVAGAASVGSTTSPATVAATTAVAGPNVRLSAALTPATVGATTVAGTPTVQAASTAAPAAVAGAASVGAPTVQTGNNPAPPTATAATAIGAPTVQTSSTTAPATVAATAAAAGTAAAGTGRTPATVTATAAIGAPTVTTTALPTPPTVTGTTTVGTPGAANSATAVPATVTGGAGIPAPTVRLSAALTPTTVGALAAVAAAQAITSLIAAPATVTGTTAVGATASGRILTAPPTVTAAGSVAAATVVLGARPAPGTVAAVGAVGTARFTVGQITTSTGTAAVTGDPTRKPSVVFTGPAATVTGDTPPMKVIT